MFLCSINAWWYTVYMFEKNTFMHSGLHIQPLRGFLHVCSSHAWGTSCLKSWNRTQIKNQIANKHKWQQQKWNLIKTEKNGKNRMGFFNVFLFFFGDQKSHQPGNKKCVAPASSTKFDWSGRAPASLQIVFPGHMTRRWEKLRIVATKWVPAIAVNGVKGPLLI